MVVCIAEDRTSCEPALRVLLSSLNAFSPGVAVWLLLERPTPGFLTWVEKFPDVSVRPFPPDDKGWNIKPSVLMAALEAGHAEAIWADSDIVFTSDFRRELEQSPPDALVGTEEALWGTPYDGDAERARAWRFDVARALPSTINTCFVRVGAHHRPLLERWRDLLRSPAYLAAQDIPLMSRPTHLVGDQDVLTALLCSRAFAHLEVSQLRRGKGIIQAFGLKGFNTKERLAALTRGMPPIIHSQQFKPWLTKSANDVGGGVYGRLNLIYLDASPYTFYASKFAGSLDGDTAWLKPRTWTGRLLRILGLQSAALTGLPLAFGFDVIFWVVSLGKPRKRAPFAGGN